MEGQAWRLWVRGLLRWADNEKVVYVIWSKTHTYVYDHFGGQLIDSRSPGPLREA